MNGVVNENQDRTVEWQALEVKSLRACSTCLPTSGDGQRKAKGQLVALEGGTLQCVLQDWGWHGSEASHAVVVEGY